MRILVTLNEQQYAALQSLMRRDLQTNRSAYIGMLIARARFEDDANSRGKGRGRPRKDDANSYEGEDLPDENAPRTLKNPYPEYVPLADRDKLINEYELLMLEEKVAHQKHQ